MHLARFACAAALSLAAASAQATGGDVPPAESQALNRFLQSGGYKRWPHESAPHPSRGPHPVTVQTYLNPAMQASLAAGNKDHPAGSAIVKELFDDKGAIRGWAVSVKTGAKSRLGKGWYWYEVLSPAADAKPDYAGQGLLLCSACHATGKDYVLSDFPLK
ncbi:MAG: hypothetical protein ROZ00_00560 [Denitratisoma sp.]|nr:hypothetical protein [Denitratisoma sp.]